jgi:hypothetical protein
MSPYQAAVVAKADQEVHPDAETHDQGTGTEVNRLVLGLGSQQVHHCIAALWTRRVF